MKKVNLFFAFILISVSLAAQLPQQQIMYMDNQAIDFRGATPVLINGLSGYPFSTNNTTSRNGVHDQNGNLLFYIVDDVIINKNGINIGQLSMFGIQTRGEIAIVPVPNLCTQFFIIEQNASSGSPCGSTTGLRYNLSYSVVDVSLSGGQGGVISTGNLLNTCNFVVSSAIAVGKLNNDNTRFLYQIGVAGSNGNAEFLRYTLNGNGTITSTTSLNTITTNVGFSGVSELDLSFNNDMLTFATGSNLFVLYLDGNGNVNTSMGNQGNGLSIFAIGGNLSGVEFSPNGNNLFVGQFNQGIRVVNPLTGSSTPLLGTNISSYGSSQLELAYDPNGNNKIYVLNQNGDLGQIEDVDNPIISNIVFNDAVLTGINLTYDSFTNFGNLQLPDQIDGMDYTAHFTATPECCIIFTELDVQEDKANQFYGGTQTWSPSSNPFGSTTGTVTVKDMLFIQNGANITINNMRFEFAPGARLIVENGARLNINNTTLTVYTGCGGTGLMWQGVEVWGQPGNQTLVAGWFTANNSLIEHALEGAVNFRRPLPLTAGGAAPNTFGFNGGVIRTSNNTIFRNNAKDVVFNPFTAMFNGNAFNDNSSFIKTTFITDAPLNDASLSNASIVHATLNAVTGITFTQCTFTNTANIQVQPGQFPELIRGSGIIASDAKFSVRGSCANLSFPCTSFNNSVFNNLSIGIRSIAVNRAQTANITNTTFFNNWRSIFLRGMDIANVSDNGFDIGASAAAFGLRSYGLYLDNCSGYKVENNNFTTSFGGHVGVYVKNSGPLANEIYRNTFSNLVVGSQSAQVNGDGQDFGDGLVFRCNEYETISDYDILISSGLLKDDHGFCFPNSMAPANNQFSYTATGDFWAETTSLGTPTYRYSPPGTANLMPRNGFFNIFNTAEQECTNLPVFNSATFCPKRVTRTRTKLTVAVDSMRVVLDSLTGLIDAGSTQNLLNVIATQSGGNVKNALLAASPYLTDDVLLAYLATNPPAGHLQQILLANSPLSDAVAAYLVNMNVPKGIKNQINNAQTGVSAMEMLNQEISFTQTEIARTENDLIRDLLFDEVTNDGFALVEDFLMQNTSRTIEQEQLLALVRIANQDSVAARQQLDALDGNPENTDFCKLHNTVVDVMNAPEGTMELANDTSLVQPVKEVADATTGKQEVANAGNLLENIGLRIPYNEVIEIVAPQSNNMRLGSLNNETNATNTKENGITLYPNPANGQITVAHKLETKNGTVSIQIMDIMGRVLLNKTINNSNNNIDIKQLSSGLYFFTVSQNGNVLESGKLMVE